jgi:hypothetical protein
MLVASSRKIKLIALFFLVAASLFVLVGYFTKTPTIKPLSIEEISQGLFSSSIQQQNIAWKALAELNNQQRETIKSDVFKFVDNKIDKRPETNDFKIFRINNMLVTKISQYYPNDKMTTYLIKKNQLNQATYLANRLLAFNQLFDNWPVVFQNQLDEAILLRDQITAILPNSAFGEDFRLDFALLRQSEKAISANQQQQSENFIQKVSKTFSQTDYLNANYLNDIVDRMGHGSHWSNKHYPVILSDEWLVGLEPVFPNQAIWIQKQPALRMIQEKIATHYLQSAEKLAAEHRYFLALSTLDKARYFASNVPSVELSYELEKKRYDLFLAERNNVEDKIKRAGQEKIFETLLAIGAISQAENLLIQPDEFQESFIQTKAPVMIKAAYDNLAAFTQLQDEIEGDKAVYYAVYDLSSLHPAQNNDLLMDEEVLAKDDEIIKKLSAKILKSRMTYLKRKQTKDIIKLPPAVNFEVATLTNVEPVLYGANGVSQFIVLPAFVAEKKETPVVAQKTTPVVKKPNVVAEKKTEAKKTPVDRLAAKLVETTAKYAGKDECAKAWHYSVKKTSVACHDKIAGSERPISLVVIPLNNDTKRLYAISENPVSFGDYNRYCLLSGECKPIATKPNLKEKKPKKDDDLPEGGLDLSDVQESIEEYDDFCVISGSCSGTSAEQNARPINTLSKQQIANYIKWLSKTTKQTYRLPTVEERLFALKRNPNAKLALDNNTQQVGFHVVREIK